MRVASDLARTCRSRGPGRRPSGGADRLPLGLLAWIVEVPGVDQPGRLAARGCRGPRPDPHRRQHLLVHRHRGLGGAHLLRAVQRPGHVDAPGALGRADRRGGLPTDIAIRPFASGLPSSAGRSSTAAATSPPSKPPTCSRPTCGSSSAVFRTRRGRTGAMVVFVAEELRSRHPAGHREAGRSSRTCAAIRPMAASSSLTAAVMASSTRPRSGSCAPRAGRVVRPGCRSEVRTGRRAGGSTGPCCSSFRCPPVPGPWRRASAFPAVRSIRIRWSS